MYYVVDILIDDEDFTAYDDILGVFTDYEKAQKKMKQVAESETKYLKAQLIENEFDGEFGFEIITESKEDKITVYTKNLKYFMEIRVSKVCQ